MLTNFNNPCYFRYMLGIPWRNDQSLGAGSAGHLERKISKKLQFLSTRVLICALSYCSTEKKTCFCNSPSCFGIRYCTFEFDTDRNQPGAVFSSPVSLLHIRSGSSVFNCTLATSDCCQNVTFPTPLLFKFCLRSWQVTRLPQILRTV